MYRFIVLLLSSLLASHTFAQTPERHFRMGFTPYPPTYDQAGYQQAYTHIQNNADIISHTFQEGVPWAEALLSSDYRDYPLSLQNHWDFLLETDAAYIPGMPRYISMLPTNITYNGLAPAWTAAGPSQGLTPPWDSYEFDNADVKTALLNYCIALIEAFQPEYFGLGVEINILMAKRFDLWAGYKDLNQYLYTELKLRYPELYVFPTIQHEHMLGHHSASAQLKTYLEPYYPEVLWTEVYYLMFYSDALVLSTFPYLALQQISPEFYSLAMNIAAVHGKPVAIDQMGELSQSVELSQVTLQGSIEYQTNYIYYMLQLAYYQQFLFAINFFTQDYGDNYGSGDISQSWAYTGLLDVNGNAKPALDAWQLFFELPYVGGTP